MASNRFTMMLFVLCMSAACANAQIALTVNNGDFENSSPLSAPSGWTVSAGSNPLWVGDSAMGGADPGSGYLSDQFLSGSWQYSGLPNASSLIGGDANSGLLYQDIDLTPHSAEIGLGNLHLGLSYAYYHNDGGDLGTIAYDFFDSGGASVGQGYGAQTTSGGGWQFIEELGATEVPTNAATLRISLGAERVSSGSARNVAFDAIGASLQPPPPPGMITDRVNGNLIQFDSDGNWTWYTDERTIVDPNNGNVLVNSVGFDETVQGGSYPGNVDVVNFNPSTGRRVRTQLSNQVGGNPQIQNDDHNVGALLVLPDGRYLAMYANHGNNGGLGDEFTRFRVSTDPGDSTSWSEEKLYNWFDNVPGANTHPGGSDNQANVSYHNIFYLSDEDQVYNISRSYGMLSTNGAGQNMPNIIRYDPDTNEVEWAGQFLESSAQGYSAYPKYVSDGKSRIYFTTTETHPRNYNNSIYSGYIEGGQTFDMQGNLIDENLFDSNVTAGAGSVPDVTDFTLVDAPDALGEGQNRLWTTDAALDSQGNLMALYTSRNNPDGSTDAGSTNNPIDHRLHFSRWNPDSESWESHEIAKMGPRLYGPEQDYTGLGALIPGDENTLYISTPYDPRDPEWETETDHHEIYKGEYDGSDWNWTAVTENSSVDNLRPIAPDTHGVGPQSVFWFRGDYNTAHNINAAVVGIVDRDEVIGQSVYVDADDSNTTRTNGAAIGATGPAAASGADDNQWHERTGYGNGGSVYASNESGSENAAMLRTTIEDLDAGLYDVFAYFWGDNDEDWRLMAGLEQDNLVDFRRYGSQHADAESFESIEIVADDNNDLLLYRAYLGRKSVGDGDDIQVFIDDWETLNGNASRTWYDGVGYALVAPLLQGDFNGDGSVDAADFTVWRDNLGGNNSALNGAGDESGASFGVVDMADYDMWVAQFGQQLDSPGETSVPEPGTLVLLAVAAVLPTRRRRRG
ncbi:hypothetical protein Mal64_05880 [Pseudobythopirellula maris]|uniref:PEP-CTERM protein-sorting domain-containing protein n=1 Tax=Pseudobythopirellula maris TaxID=2527991 RepID=A0A5C5ZRR4_9BACT|nr:BNR-4 repeat-containing protein [Pseudobythopirellula maris]TWT90204.1 hypothetical protein Mal64_05880 [Pseudobythopirellula maris]